MNVLERQIELPTRTIAARFAPSTLDRAERTVEVCWSAGETAMRQDLFGAFEEELPLETLRLDRLNNAQAAAPLVDAHRLQDGIRAVVGVVVPGTAKVVAGEARAVVRFDTGELGEEAMRKVEEGIITQLSPGYDAVYERVYRDTSPVPLLRALEWTPFEISLAPVGVDAGTYFRSQPSGPTRRYAVRTRKEQSMSIQVETAAHAAPPVASVPLVHGASVAPPIDEAEVERRVQSGIAERSKRVNEARSLARSLGIDEDKAERLAVELRSFDDVKSNLLDMKVEAQKSERIRSENPAASVSASVGTTAYEKLVEVAKHGMLTRMAGTEPKDVATEFGVLGRNEIGRFARMSVVDIGEELVEARGVSHRTFRGRGRLERAKMLMGAVPIPGMTRSDAGGMGSSDLSILLGSVFGSRIQQKYRESQDDWKRVAKEVNLEDFTEVPVYGFSNHPPLLDVPEGAEIQRGAFTQSNFNVKLGKGARIISFTWEMMVNDRFGALEQIVNDRFMAVKRWERRKFVAALLANKIGISATNFFSSGNGNISDVTGPPSTATLIAAFKRMARQRGIPGVTGEVDAAGDRLSAIPKRWLLGAEDIITAAQLLEPGGSSEPVVVAPTAATSRPTSAMRALADNLVMEPDLDDQDTVFSVLFADPEEIAAVQYGHLVEQPGPFVQEEDGFEVTGKDFAVIDPFYVVLADPRGAVKITRT